MEVAGANVVGRSSFALERSGLPCHGSHVAQLGSLGVIRASTKMKLTKYLMIAGGLLFSSFAIAYLIRIPEALRYAQNVTEKSQFTGSSAIIVVCANIAIWGGLGAVLIWRGFKMKDKP